jgi:hypothetical protein
VDRPASPLVHVRCTRKSANHWRSSRTQKGPFASYQWYPLAVPPPSIFGRNRGVSSTNTRWPLFGRTSTRANSAQRVLYVVIAKVSRKLCLEGRQRVLNLIRERAVSDIVDRDVDGLERREVWRRCEG